MSNNNMSFVKREDREKKRSNLIENTILGKLIS